jgi:hypothetical protein
MSLLALILMVRSHTSPASLRYMRQPFQSGIIQTSQKIISETGLTRNRYHNRLNREGRTSAVRRQVMTYCPSSSSAKHSTLKAER